MKPCLYCGRENRDDAACCVECGTGLHVPATSAHPNLRAGLSNFLGRMTTVHKRCAFAVAISLVCLAAYFASTRLHRARMPQADVIQVANTAASAAGFHLGEYNAPVARFEFPERDRTWTVMYSLRVRAPWNPPLPALESTRGAPSHFLVTVDDKTRRTRLAILR